MTEIILQAKSHWKLIDLKEIWDFKELLFIFSWKDLKVRYKQTILGILWVVFQPLTTVIIFTIFFGNLAKISSGPLPYSLFSLCGLTFWIYFASSLSHISDSMVANENIIKKVYFPKIILPVSSTITGLIDLLINFLILVTFASYLRYYPTINSLWIIPFVVFQAIITALGIGLFLSSLNVKYRDVRYILPFFIQILLFITPVIYPLSIVSERNKLIMALNPMTSVVELTRYAFSNDYKIYPFLILISFLSSLMLLTLGLIYFRKTEQFFADIV